MVLKQGRGESFIHRWELGDRDIILHGVGLALNFKQQQ